MEAGACGLRPALRRIHVPLTQCLIGDRVLYQFCNAALRLKSALRGGQPGAVLDADQGSTTAGCKTAGAP